MSTVESACDFLQLRRQWPVPVLSGKRKRVLIWAVVHASIITLLIYLDSWLYSHLQPLLVQALIHHQNSLTPNRLGAAFRLIGLWPATALAIVLFWRLHPRGRRWVAAIVLSALGTASLVEVTSRCVGHMRPSQADGRSVFVPFNAWHHESRWGASFPASEPAVAMSLMVLLGRAFPRANMVFWCLAIGSGMVRMAVAAHFPSDTYAAWVVGYCFAHVTHRFIICRRSSSSPKRTR